MMSTKSKATEGNDILTLDDIKKARDVIYSSPDIVKTPLLCHVQNWFPSLPRDMDLYIKMENAQTTGCFKIRGVTNQMEYLPPDVRDGVTHPVTFSAGNYGKALSHCLRKRGLKGLVLMIDNAPDDRVELIESYGMEAKKVPSDKILDYVDQHVAQGYTLIHPFNDVNAVAGYGSLGLEILEDVPEPDIVLVCCGGGALVSGIATSLKLSGCTDCKIYAVEPIGAPTMYESFKAGHAVTITTVKSVATGLMPPSAGEIPYQLCKKYVEEVFLVSDEDIVECMKQLYNRGLKVEPAGSAAMAALLTGKIRDIQGKRVVVVLTGGNITPNELAKLIG